LGGVVYSRKSVIIQRGEKGKARNQRVKPKQGFGKRGASRKQGSGRERAINVGHEVEETTKVHERRENEGVTEEETRETWEHWGILKDFVG